MTIASYQRQHTETLVKDVGTEAVRRLTGRSRATLGRYHSDSDDHDDRFMPIDVVAEPEAASRFPDVTAALADFRMITLCYDTDRRNSDLAGVNQDVVALAQRLAMLMADHDRPIGDGKITANAAKRRLRATPAIRQVLLAIKLQMQEEAGWRRPPHPLPPDL